ncbi:MAG: alpha/beta hydrolase [Pirellulales bacterium]|nr:alpha/beta hydrolase [Pirellulales bacterium]
MTRTHFRQPSLRFGASALLAIFALAGNPGLSAAEQADQSQTHLTRYHKVKIDGVNVFYREAGPRDAPTIVLLHGFPTSSHMFRTLIPKLSDKFHVIAPDYPGYGNSDAPPADKFDYTFDNISDVVDRLLESLGVQRYALYVMDYGAPVGFRIAAKHPQRITGLVIQNGNAYDEGIDNEFWEPLKKYWESQSPKDRDALRGFLQRDATIWQYTHGTRDPQAVSPDNWNVDQPLLDRDGNQEIQLDMFLSYGSNPPLYPQWQAYFRKHQPPALIVWGKNDQIFPAAGAHPYKRDLKDVETHLLNTGHFALEEDVDFIAARIRAFLTRIQ